MQIQAFSTETRHKLSDWTGANSACRLLYTHAHLQLLAFWISGFCCCCCPPTSLVHSQAAAAAWQCTSEVGGESS